MTERLTAEKWVDFALATLAREGFAAVKADVLARRLGVSRGSFYWHFGDLGFFHSRLIERWKHKATEAIIADIERYNSPEQRLDALLRHAFGRNGSLEIHMRTWAENNAEAARAVNAMDRRRREYIKQLLEGAGVSSQVAATRVQVFYWAYLGASVSRTRLTGAELDRVVAELMHLGLGNPAGKALSGALSAPSA